MTIKNKLKEILTTIPNFKFFICFTMLSAVYTLKCFYNKVPDAILIKIIAITAILIPVIKLINPNLGEKYRLNIAPFILISTSLSMLLLNYDLGVWLFIGAFCYTVCCISDIINNDIEQQLEQLEDIRTEMENLQNPNSMLTRLGVDILKLHVGWGLLDIADFDREGLLLTKIRALRQKLTDDLGYIIPKIHVQDSSKLDIYEYEIFVRDKTVDKGIVYPDKYKIFSDEWDQQIKDIPNNIIVDIDPVTKQQIYWIDKELAEKYKDKIQTVLPDDAIIEHLKYCAIKYVDEILTDVDIIKYVNIVEATSPVLINFLKNNLSVIDVRKIFVNLIQDNVSVKDIHLIFLKLCEYVQITNDIDVLTEKLKTFLTKSNY